MPDIHPLPFLSATVQISSALPEDARAIAQVHVRSWQQAYAGLLPREFLAALSVEPREAMWRTSMDRGTPELLVAKAHGNLCGFVAFGSSRDEGATAGAAEIMALYLDPAAWSTGVGRALWLRCLQRLQAEGFTAATLWVLAGNARAIRFYEAAGFRPDTASRKPLVLAGMPCEEIRFTRILG